MRSERRVAKEIPVRRIADGSGRVRLLIRGFFAQRTHTVESIAAAIEWLPAYHLQGLREVTYVPGGAFNYPSLGLPSSEWAEYSHRERAVFIYNVDASALFWHVLYHEIGHHVYLTAIDATLRKLWATRVHPQSRCPTPYAYTSPAEDFAECYALYAQDTAKLGDFPGKFRFMRDSVFSLAV
jgi:hypothetical protein